MRARVDFEAKTIVAGIRDLVEPTRESARGVGMMPLMRAELGQNVHKRYQSQRTRDVPGFRAEVGVRLTGELDGFRVLVRGRMDGLIDSLSDGQAENQAENQADDLINDLIDDLTDDLTNDLTDDLIDGRAPLIVEEVKSMALSAREIAVLAIESLSDHALQARLYALALHHEFPGRDIDVRLILVSILDGYQRTLEVHFSPQATTYALDRLLRRALAEAEEARARAARRALVARALVFPYAGMRPQQDRLIADIERGLDDDRPVLAWAPTGIGKTVSALFAGLRSTLARGKSLYFATAKTTQQTLVARTFEDLVAAAAPGAEAGIGITAITLRAKERMCPPGDLQCHPEVCPYLADFAARAERRDAVQTLMDERAHVTPERIYEYGRRESLCPFELSLRIANRAELVIADYNYVYDGAIALGPFSDETRAGSAAVIVDEGHNLLDRARGYESAFIARAAVQQVLERVSAGVYLAKDEAARTSRAQAQLQIEDLDPDEYEPIISGPHLFAQISALCRALDDFIEHTWRRVSSAHAAGLGRGLIDDCSPLEREPTKAEPTKPETESTKPEAELTKTEAELTKTEAEPTKTEAAKTSNDTWCELADIAIRALLAFALYCRTHRLVFPRDPLPGLLREVVRVRDGILANEPELIPYVAGPRAPDGAGLGVLCVDPGRRLAARHARALGTVVMSATLTPLPYYAEVLGFAHMDAILSTVASPFPVHNRSVLVVPTVDTSYRRRHHHVAEIARTISDIVAVRPGRYIAFFSSFAFLEQVRRALDVPPEQLLVQVSGMAQNQRQDTLARLESGPGPALLLAVTGGVFAEGIDLPGERLIGAIVVGPSLPPVSFERTLMRSYYDTHGRDGFAYAMLYPGMQRVIQSAGRVIRSMTDRGVIALLGRRFLEPRYAELLPPDWCRAGVGRLATRTPVHRLVEFWSAVAASPGDKPSDRPGDKPARDRAAPT